MQGSAKAGQVFFLKRLHRPAIIAWSANNTSTCLVQSSCGGFETAGQLLITQVLEERAVVSLRLSPSCRIFQWVPRHIVPMLVPPVCSRIHHAASDTLSIMFIHSKVP